MSRFEHGVAKHNEIRKSALDAPQWQLGTMLAWPFHGIGLGVSATLIAVVGFVFPTLSKVLLPVYLLLFAVTAGRKETALFFLPAFARSAKDKYNIKRDKKGRRLDVPEGIAYMGNCLRTRLEAWWTNSALRQHLMYLATTGGGKSVGLSSLCVTIGLMNGRGYSYSDGKADLELPANHMAVNFRLNRIDDVLLLNFITGNQDSWNPVTHTMSNTFNYMSDGSSTSNIEIGKALLDGDGDIWAKRAESYYSAVTRPLCYLRDTGEIALSVTNYLEYMQLESVGKLAGREDIPEPVVRELYGFVKTIPGLKKKDFEELLQGESVKATQPYDQFGFITMQLIPVFNMLAGDYASIFVTKQGHISMEDVIINNRVLLTLLPALEKSETGIANLGRINIAAEKNMMAGALGNQIEGELQQNLGSRPTSSPTPYFSVKDEIGAYFVAGTATGAAQARGIGMSICYSSQDFPGMKKLGKSAEQETEQIKSNTNTKIIGVTKDSETLKMIEELTGEAMTRQYDRLSDHDGSGHLRQDSASFQSRKRVTVRDFSDLIEGEFYLSYRDDIEAMEIPMFADWKSMGLRKVRLNDFVPCPPPSSDEIDQLIEMTLVSQKAFDELLRDPTPLTLDDEASNLAQTCMPLMDADGATGLPLQAVGLAMITKMSDELRGFIDSMFNYSGEDSVTTETVGESGGSSAEDHEHYMSMQTAQGDGDQDSYWDDRSNQLDLSSLNDSISESSIFARVARQSRSQQMQSAFEKEYGRLFDDALFQQAGVHPAGAKAAMKGLNEAAGMNEQEAEERAVEAVQNMAQQHGHPQQPVLEPGLDETRSVLRRLKRDLT